MTPLGDKVRVKLAGRLASMLDLNDDDMAQPITSDILINPYEAADHILAALDLSPPVVEEGEALKRYDIEPWQDENGFMFIERSENPAGAWMLAEDVLSASPAPEPQAVAWPEPKIANPDIGSSTGVPYLDSLIHQVMDAQQDINLAANEGVSQALADASALLDEVEETIRRLAAPLSGGDGKVTDEAIDRAIRAYCDEPSNDMRDMMRAALSTMGGGKR